VKKAFIILVVVIVVFTGLPLVMAMGGTTACQDCGPGLMTRAGDCLSVAAVAMTLGALLVLVGARLRLSRSRIPAWRFVSLLDRPPQLV